MLIASIEAPPYVLNIDDIEFEKAKIKIYYERYWCVRPEE